MKASNSRTYRLKIEERWRTSTESLMETSQKHYRSTSSWIVSLLSLLHTNFKWKLSAKIVGPFKLSHFPLFIGEKGRWLPPSLPRQAGLLPPEATFSPESFGWAQMSLVAIYTPILLNTPPFHVFGWFLSETSQNFMDYATMLVLSVPKWSTKVHIPTTSVPRWNLGMIHMHGKKPPNQHLLQESLHLMNFKFGLKLLE